MKFKLPERENGSRKIRKKPKKQYRNPIFLALEWKNMIKNGDVLSKAELARKLGISRARVTQIMNLLKLKPKLINKFKEYGDLLSTNMVTERFLRFLFK